MLSFVKAVTITPACMMSFGSISQLLAKCMLKYYRISECPCPILCGGHAPGRLIGGLAWPHAESARVADDNV